MSKRTSRAPSGRTNLSGGGGRPATASQPNLLSSPGGGFGGGAASFARPHSALDSARRTRQVDNLFGGGASGRGGGGGGSGGFMPPAAGAYAGAPKPQSARSKASSIKSMASDQSLGPNQFSRPDLSKTQPLRSLLLDPDVNNIPRSATQSSLRLDRRRTNMPHISYDIDGDGIVSQDDYFLAKRFDLDGNGVLDQDEREVGRFIMAQDFFRMHRDDIHLYGDEWKQPEADNIERLATSTMFQKQLNKLKETEKHFRDVGSQGATPCLQMANKDVTKHNFYSNKFDTTAWNDHGANPRHTGQFNHHEGSREKMRHLRKIHSRETCQVRLDAAEERRPQNQLNKRRTSYVTNITDGLFAFPEERR